MTEINLLDRLPQTKRDLKARAQNKTPEDIDVAKQFGRDFFDGERCHGYGGYRYDGRWVPVVERFVEHYQLAPDSKILDVGCAKGFLMHDFRQILPDCEIRGLDISKYARDNAYHGMEAYIDIGSAENLPYEDNTYDLVVSINSIHNLPFEKCMQSLQEIERVGKAHKFISIDAWRTEQEHEALLHWILTAETYMSVDDWVTCFEKYGYTGDYWWFIP